MKGTERELRFQLMQMTLGDWRSQVLFTASELGVFGVLRDGATGVANPRVEKMSFLNAESLRDVPRQGDVVVIGGGPAGSMAGTFLSQRGYDIVPFDMAFGDFGYTRRALHVERDGAIEDAINVCALFNIINRIAIALGFEWRTPVSRRTPSSRARGAKELR